MTSRDSRKYILAGNYRLLDQLYDQRDDYKGKFEEARRDFHFWKNSCDAAHNLGAERLAAAHKILKMCLELLEDLPGNINPERGYAEEMEAEVLQVRDATRQLLEDQT